MQRTCTVCGQIFDGHYLSKYCVNCIDYVKNSQAKESQQRKRANKQRKIGSTSFCERCNEAYTVKGAIQKYCVPCSIAIRNERLRKKYKENDEFRVKMIRRTIENHKRNPFSTCNSVKKYNNKKRQEKIASGKAFIKNVSIWTCKKCFESYHPTSSRQIYCPVCSKIMRLENMRLWRERKKNTHLKNL